MERTARPVSGLYLCSRCGLHAFESLRKKLAHERGCTPVSGAGDVQLHRSTERRTPEWLDGALDSRDEAYESSAVSRQLRMLAREGVTV
jgi:hypothetical protein